MEYLKKLSLIDWLIFAAILVALVLGIFTKKHFRETTGVNAHALIRFQVFLRSVTLTGNNNPIIPGEDSFITIRNVPYTTLKVLNSQIDTKKVVLPNNKNDGNDFMIAPDYSQLFVYDILVEFEDEAKVSKDGYVIGGNKIKIGMPITLEGTTYRFNGTVSDINLLKITNSKDHSPNAREQLMTQPVTDSSVGQTQVPQQNANMMTKEAAK